MYYNKSVVGLLINFHLIEKRLCKDLVGNTRKINLSILLYRAPIIFDAPQPDIVSVIDFLSFT
ncbi:MAG TPA: hypothetical protein DF282_19155 [Hyphomonas sp.]|nr:hypothetical protein [Hyphomonas sp.]